MAATNPHDQVAVVTGASSGIGRAIALALAARGSHVALAARNCAALELLACEIRDLGREALVVPTDVTDRAQVEHLIAATMEQWGRIDILVASAGAYVRSRIPELTVEKVERSMAVNFYGALYAVLAAMPHMIAQRHGHMVLVTSMDARKGLPLDAPYVAAKSALTGLGEVMRQELRETGIHTLLVLPGRVDTPLIAHLDVPAISAKISPEAVARATVRGIERRHAEVIVPFQARMLQYVNSFSPRLADWVVRVMHLEGEERST